ncbi:hypothetical protein, conserved [Trypanosoma brucei gambiense DAL972]|uniref:Uncharacterized protein n=1 Tax=Trypanosoma brucei gambiense (strain MHOM/CI/86/DAL972) TaxID=679716 RepID=C9ZVY9_TRYB9|nr:hypothetical protein, conserved [Trypanosoma brucei gambiense DAL972]CBH13577.1 hypothetical protein, conserved [Trypanosoma brucei gambiense DAL972]|eukprot:XP_011775854.1 hypothetical protein, conserved [Trypanosoma brucei gambiense DAL972]
MDATNSCRAPVPPSHGLQRRLEQMLQKQVATEERIARQGELIQRITYGFTVLREYATRAVTHMNLSLHDLLLVETYIEIEPEEQQTKAVVTDASSADGSMCLISCESSTQSLVEEAKEVYAAFVRKRVLDETCPEPDAATQFHSLTAASFYLLFPHLTVMLEEFVGAFASATSPESSTTSGTAMTPEWWASLGRVIRFIELGVKHFPEVFAGNELLSRLQVSISAVVEKNIRHGEQSGIGAALCLSQRVTALHEKMQHLNVSDTGSDHSDGCCSFSHDL